MKNYEHYSNNRSSSIKMPKIFITSYPYINERYFRVFDYFENKNNLVFILPKKWKTRAGFVLPPERPDIKIIPAKAFFYGSHYPVVKGLLKGWMPATGRILRKYAKPGDVLFTATEPNLLTTFMNGRLAKKLNMAHFFHTWQNIPYRLRLRGAKLKATEWLIRKNIELSVGIICGTNKALEVTKPYLDSRIKVAVIPQAGVDINVFKPSSSSDFRRRHNLENKILFVFAAVFDERKGVFTTIEAFNKVLKSLPSAHLVMIGIGKLWDRAQEIVEGLGIKNHVTFIKWMPNDELASVFTTADVLVHPSEPYRDWEEQYGWTMLQASSSGLPVIATDIGSISESILDEKTGILIKPKNPDALAQAMIYLAQHPEIRKQMGAAGRQHILNRFSHQSVAGRMESFLNSYGK